MDEINEWKANFDNTEYECDEWNDCAFKCPTGQVWYNQTNNLQHDGVFTCDNYLSLHWQPNDGQPEIEDGVGYKCTVLDAVCGNVGGTFALEDGVTYQCNQGNCDFSCPDNLLPFPLAQVSCDSQNGVWNEGATSISCKDTRCGDIADLYQLSGITASCAYSEIDDRSTCDLSCQPGYTLTPATTVVCNSAQEVSPSQDTQIVCPACRDGWELTDSGIDTDS